MGNFMHIRNRTHHQARRTNPISSQNDKSSQNTQNLFDYTKKNKNSLKQYKNQKNIDNKNVIQSIHDKLEVYKVTNGEMNKLTNLNSFLSIAIKKKFL